MSFILSETTAVITNTTVYSSDCMKEFYKAHRKGYFRSLVILYLIICPVVILLWVNALYRHIHSGLPIPPSTISVTAVMVFCACIHFILVPILQKRGMKKHPAHEATVTFCFTEDHFNEQTVSATVNSSTTLQYAAIHKVTESANQIYLYNTANSAYVVSKNGFTQGTVDDLKALLRAKLEPKKIKFK